MPVICEADVSRIFRLLDHSGRDEFDCGESLTDKFALLLLVVCL